MRPDDLHPGDLIAGKYRVRAILARQPSMLVEAFHTEFDQRVIVKVLPAWAADSKEVERFRREARVLAKLESEYVARILDVGSEKDGSFYLVRQHLEGIELGEHVQKVGALPLDEAIAIVMQLAEAVAETHVHGIVIRELSPAHVQLARRVGGGPVAKITDFGTAKLLRDNAAPAGNSSLTATAMFGLSPYSSPEMVRKAKNVDGRTDVWSLGAILYHLLTGQAPFQGDIATLMLAITRDDPTPPSMLRRGLPQEMDQIIAWALAKDVDRRFRDVNAFAHALVPYGTSEAQVLAERITALHAAARGHKDGPGSRPSPTRTQPPPRSVPPRPGGSVPPPSMPPMPGAPGSMRPPPVPTGLGPPNGPRTQPPPPMPGPITAPVPGGIVAAMRSRLPSGLDDLPAGEDDATVVLGASEQQTGRKPNTIPPPPPSMPPTPWQPGAERARSPRLVPPAALSQQPSMASQMGSVSSALGGQMSSMSSGLGAGSLGSSSLQGSSHGLSSSQSLSRDAVAAQASSLSPASSQALQRAAKTQGGQDRRVLVGAMASMAVLLPVILVLLLSKSSTPTSDLAAAPIPIATERAVAPTPDPLPPPTSAPIVATAEPTAPPVAPSAAGTQVVAVPDPTAPVNNAGTRPPPRTPPPREPPPREPPPKKEPPKKEEPKKEEPKSSGGGSNGNLLAIASGGSCTFIVNGSPKGSGSSVKVALSPGNYSVTCKPSSGASKSRSVSIKSGETSMLTFKL